MASMIKGHTITLYQKVQIGVDGFNSPIYATQELQIDNVLICPVSSDDIVSTLDLYGKKAVYKICIPKGDTHIWENQQVGFLGHKWDVFTFPLEGFDEDMPLDWNKQYFVERYNGSRYEL